MKLTTFHSIWIIPSIIAFALFLQYAEGTFRHCFLRQYLTDKGYTNVRLAGYRTSMEGEHGLLTGFEAVDSNSKLIIGTVVFDEHGRRIKYE